MTKLDIVFERIRKLPADRRDALVTEIDWLLEDEAKGSLLTDAQWAAVRAALADKDEPTSSHEDVFRRLESEGE